VRIGPEVHPVLDAAPQYVIAAKVPFAAAIAQLAPKTVETVEERQKLTFRIKAHIDPGLLTTYIRGVETGLPGMAQVQLDRQSEWPARRAATMPQ
jgi:HlyD family secretion protein